MAHKNKLKILSLNSTPDERQNSTLLDLKLSGDFLAFLDFLQELEKAPRYSQSNTFTSTKTNGSLQHQLQLRIFHSNITAEN